MEYDHILIRYSEIALKGKNRTKFLTRLQENIQYKLREFPSIKVRRTQGRIFVLLNGQNPVPILERCRHIFGISSLSLALKVENDVNQIEKAVLYVLKNSNHTKTFKVTVKRANKNFPVPSQEMNHVLGSYLLKNTSDYTVDVHNPDLEIKVEIRDDATYITTETIEGAGGLPVGTGGKTLLLLSGGIDSPVAGYLAMKRGVELEVIHFHSPPFTSERAKQKVLDLTKALTVFGKAIKVHVIPFTELQQEINRVIPSAYTMTVMRRVMLRISEIVCRNESILSMTTGENLGQVASQTMESMHSINEVTNYPILRPLITMDKKEIIEVSKKINTYPISIRPYEDCCTIFIPKSPKTNPKREKVKEMEKNNDFSTLIDEAVKNKEIIFISDEESVEKEMDLLL